MTVSTRQARKQFAKLLNSTEATAIGDAYAVRALIVPIRPYSRWDSKAKRQAHAECRNRLRKALEALEKE